MAQRNWKKPLSANSIRQARAGPMPSRASAAIRSSILGISSWRLRISAVCKRNRPSIGCWSANEIFFPFTVRNSSVGYGTATFGEKIRAELSLPLWSRLSSYAEIAHVFREGRVQFSRQRKVVRTGFDFARAVAELGVDRGIESFQRYAFIERNGQANLATPLGKFEVRERPHAQLVHHIDQWLDSFSRAASGDKVQPRFVRAQQLIEDAIFRLCESGSADHLREVLISLGLAEAELAGGEKFRSEKNLRPIAGLRLSWAGKCNDGSDEFKLAAALLAVAQKAAARSAKTSSRSMLRKRALVGRPNLSARSGAKARWRTIWQPSCTGARLKRGQTICPILF